MIKWSRFGAWAGFLAVVLGAFGAHGLATMLKDSGRVETWETAVLYHIVHAPMLLVVARFAPSRARGLALAGFASGMIVFSGTLYLLCVTGKTWLGAVTPIGGVLLLVGWAATAFAVGAPRGD